MQTIRYELDADGIATLTFDEPGSPVNTMTPGLAGRLRHAPSQVRGTRTLKGLLLASAKTTFFAGAELKGVLYATAEDAKEAFREIERPSGDFRHARDHGPAGRQLLNGAALGGGWEVALIGHAASRSTTRRSSSARRRSRSA